MPQRTTVSPHSPATIDEKHNIRTATTRISRIHTNGGWRRMALVGLLWAEGARVSAVRQYKYIWVICDARNVCGGKKVGRWGIEVVVKVYKNETRKGVSGGYSSLRGVIEIEESYFLVARIRYKSDFFLLYLLVHQTLNIYYIYYAILSKTLPKKNDDDIEGKIWFIWYCIFIFKYKCAGSGSWVWDCGFLILSTGITDGRHCSLSPFLCSTCVCFGMSESDGKSTGSV